MAKRASFQDLSLGEITAGEPLFRWLYQELRLAILDGRLKPGARLPSTRGLANRYGLSRGTVVAAFEQLLAEGYVDGKVGAGTFVAATLPDQLLQAQPGNVKGLPSAPSRARLSRRGQRMASTPFPIHAVKEIARPFRANQPALDAFPLDLWSRIVARRQRRTPRTLLADGDVRGYGPLREAVSDYLGTSRGVKCTAEQVVIVSGVQQALDLTTRLVLDPGDSVWMEDPGYVGARRVLEASGARLVAIPVDEHGLDVHAGERRCALAKLAYVTPARQSPLGVALSLERRLALLGWARRARAWIFEDDYDSEYRYAGRPLAALQGLDRSGSIIYAGSFSKVLFPSLRLGYLVIPNHRVDAFSAARSIVDRYSSVLDQAVLCDFIAEGHFARHIRRMRELYAARRAVLLDAARRELAGLLDVVACDAGLETIGWLAPGIDDTIAAETAAAQGIEVRPLSRYAIDRRVHNGLLLGFAAVDVSAIRSGVERLARVLSGVAKSHRR